MQRDRVEPFAPGQQGSNWFAHGDVLVEAGGENGRSDMGFCFLSGVG
jgi:hypothetical protein